MDTRQTELIYTELNRILHSDGFARAANLRSFLRYAVTEAVESDQPKLKEYSIATRCLGRSANFDARLDPIVRVRARTLRERLDEFYRNDPQPASVRIDLPKGSYVPAFRFDHDTGADGGAVVDEPAIGHAPAIAVVPFELVPATSQLHGLGIVFAEEIAAALALFEDLRVLGTSNRIEGIGAKTDHDGRSADYVLTGIVRHDHALVRVTANLVRVATGLRSWTQSYGFPLDNISDVRFHVELAARIVETIAQPNSPLHFETIRQAEQKSINDLNAYECLVRSYSYESDLGRESFLQAVQSLERGVQLMPENSVVSANLALVYCDGYRMCYDTDVGSDELLEKAYSAAQTAVRLNPASGFARLALSVSLFSMGNNAAARNEGERAVALNPHDASILAEYGFSRAKSGDWLAGAETAERAIKLNPLYPDWYLFTFVYMHCAAREFDAARDVLEQIRPTNYLARPLAAAAIYAELGCHDEAQAALREMRRLRPDIDHSITAILDHHKFPAETRQIFAAGLRKAGMSID